ncbi:biotin-dependent carboxyltransferase family protein [Roseivivax sp. GX 12232]|uniref:5-oxoprolinase subunit C family protein n=1 Tax=Roseivivax sp. GX 12232 TaxID=2900547 RepID=UPI001E54C8AD|nr:biotin-dependent carboxyltransferase family protein [Roseivivax sp. GX 12232]MCE0504041.1 biotin-dependent carboxyltransferase family protein [Roseivivax sp. GX 12232]
MSGQLIVHRAGPGLTLQDEGRPGYLRQGLSRGGAADSLALSEGRALLGQGAGTLALEMAGMGGEFEATEDLRIALTGAPMRASIDGARVAWHASHLLPAGARLVLGAMEAGAYGYLHLGGGVTAAPRLGAGSAHLSAGIGGRIEPGQRLALNPDPRPGATGFKIAAEPRFEGGEVRVVPSLQTEFFTPEERARFEESTFTRDARGNRMGVRFLPEGPGFASSAGLSVLSEVIVPGDIQITGDGTPFVLMCECQTTGGYPRIGAVLPADLPKVAQCAPNGQLRFRFLTLEEGLAAETRARAERKRLGARISRLIRRPEDIRDLLAYNLVGGVTAGDDLERSAEWA